VSQVVVRRVRADEGEEIRSCRLWALAEEDFRRHFLQEEERLTRDDWSARAKRGAKSKDFATFVGASGRGLVAIADGYARDDAIVAVGGMWVQPMYRGRGVGRRLVEAVSEWAVRGGASRLALTVVATNDPALTLYERAGFVAIGVPTPAKTVAGVMLQRMERAI
jgi:GNAT superfamily N-acetyltransferase